MIEFDKNEISKKTNSELLKDLFESNFHNESYISLVIEILQEKGINTSEIFKNMQTDDLVVSYCFDRDKYKLPYILLVKEELLNRNYDISTIPDIKDSKTFSSSINGEVKKKKSNSNENYVSDSFQTTFESDTDTDVLSNSSKRYQTKLKQDTPSEYYQNESNGNNNKYIGVSIAAVIILAIKLGLMYVRKESNEKQNQAYIANRYDQIAEEEKQKQELVFYLIIQML